MFPTFRSVRCIHDQAPPVSPAPPLAGRAPSPSPSPPIKPPSPPPSSPPLWRTDAACFVRSWAALVTPIEPDIQKTKRKKARLFKASEETRRGRGRGGFSFRFRFHGSSLAYFCIFVPQFSSRLSGSCIPHEKNSKNEHSYVSNKTSAADQRRQKKQRKRAAYLQQISARWISPREERPQPRPQRGPAPRHPGIGIGIQHQVSQQRDELGRQGYSRLGAVRAVSAASVVSPIVPCVVCDLRGGRGVVRLLVARKCLEISTRTMVAEGGCVPEPRSRSKGRFE